MELQERETPIEWGIRNSITGGLPYEKLDTFRKLTFGKEGIKNSQRGLDAHLTDMDYETKGTRARLAIGGLKYLPSERHFQLPNGKIKPLGPLERRWRSLANRAKLFRLGLRKGFSYNKAVPFSAIFQDKMGEFVFYAAASQTNHFSEVQ